MRLRDLWNQGIGLRRGRGRSRRIQAQVKVTHRKKNSCYLGDPSYWWRFRVSAFLSSAASQSEFSVLPGRSKSEAASEMAEALGNSVEHCTSSKLLRLHGFCGVSRQGVRKLAASIAKLNKLKCIELCSPATDYRALNLALRPLYHPQYDFDIFPVPLPHLKTLTIDKCDLLLDGAFLAVYTFNLLMETFFHMRPCRL